MSVVVTEGYEYDLAPDDGLGDWHAHGNTPKRKPRIMRFGGEDKDRTPTRMATFEVENPRTPDTGAPPDTCGFTTFAFVSLGLGLLLPWNAVLQVAGLFVSDLMFGKCSDIMFALTAANMASILSSMVIMLYVTGRWTCDGRYFVVAGFVLRAISIFVLAVLGTDASYSICVWMVILDGVGGGLNQSALYGMSATLPPKYTSATMFGSGVSGIFTSIVYFIIVGAYTIFDDESDSNFTFAGSNVTDTVVNSTDESLESLAWSAVTLYYLGGVASVLCIILTLVIAKVPFYAYYAAKAAEESTTESLLDGKDAYAAGNERKSGEANDNKADDGDQPPKEKGLKRILWVVKKLWIPALSLFFTMTICLAIYPGVLIETTPTGATAGFLMSDWIVAIFNVGDVTGRFATRWSALVPKHAKSVWIPAFLTPVWFVLSILSGMDMFQIDGVTYAISFCTAVHSGYSATVCMMLGPTLVPSNQKELAGTVMISSMLIGLTVGSFVGIALSDAVIGDAATNCSEL